jgi:hypothetical protein
MAGPVPAGWLCRSSQTEKIGETKRRAPRGFGFQKPVSAPALAANPGMRCRCAGSIELWAAVLAVSYVRDSSSLFPRLQRGVYKVLQDVTKHNLVLTRRFHSLDRLMLTGLPMNFVRRS